MKMLYILNIAKKVNNFSYSSMMAAKAAGYDFHIAGNWSYKSADEMKSDEEKYDIKIHQIDFIRSPYHPGNLKAYKQLIELCKKEEFDVIHCNTPIGGLLGRLVGAKCNIPKIIYQAHGFHFYKGAPLKNWLLYYPVEKWLAHKTDILITINKEDYEIAKKKMRLRGGGRVEYVPGVGIDTTQYINEKTLRIDKRKELGITEDDIAIISMGDLIERKNYKISIEAIAKTNNPHIHFFICGKGPEENNLKALSRKLNVEPQIHFIGYRSDIKELLNSCDIFMLSSKQEGLARSLMEAMASGLPCIVSKIRGNTDLLDGIYGGYLCETNASDDYKEKIIVLANNSSLREEMGINNIKRILHFNIDSVSETLKEQYTRIIREI